MGRLLAGLLIVCGLAFGQFTSLPAAASSSGGASGTVNTSTAGKLAYYAADGTAVSGGYCSFDGSFNLVCGTGLGVTGAIDYYDTGSGFYSTITPTTLTANRTLTQPDVTGTIATRTGAFSSNDCVKYSSGQFVSAGGACGVSGSGATVSDEYITYSGTVYGPVIPGIVTPAGASYTAVNTGTATVTNNPSGSVYISVPAGDTAGGVHMRALALPASSGYTFTVGVMCQGPRTITFCAAGLRDSASGKNTFNALLVDNGATSYVNNYQFSSSTAYAGTYQDTNIGVFPSKVFLRIQDDGTNRIYSWSINRINWNVTATTTRTNYLTPDQFVIGVSANTSSSMVQGYFFDVAFTVP